MTALTLLLFVFVGLALASHRLGHRTYALMGVVIAVYLVYARSHW